MVEIDIASFKSRVKAILLHNAESISLAGVGDVYTTSLDGVIGQNMEHAMQMCVMLCPLNLLGGTNNLIDTREYASTAVTTVAASDYNIMGGFVKPDSLCRYVSIKADSWAKECEAFDMQPYAGYEIARDKYNGTLGTSGRPYARVAIANDGNRVIEFYPYKAGDKVKVKGVGFKFVNEATKKVKCENELFEAACWQCAYLVAMEKGMSNADRYKAESMMQMGLNAQ